MKNPNVLKFFDMNRFEIPPTYLEYITIPTHEYKNLASEIVEWIEANCKSRYFAGVVTGVSSENKISNFIKIGFENPKELSYFTLACPHLK